MFEKPSPLAPVSPRGALGACTEELDDRFRGLDTGVRASLLRDMRAEDEVLKQYIEKCRLEKWFDGAFDLAKRDVQEEMNEETQEGKAMKEMAQQVHEMEQKIASDGGKAAMDMLRSKPRYKARPKLNGSVGGFRNSLVR
jgi:nuclear pore complex protein Nup133